MRPRRANPSELRGIVIGVVLGVVTSVVATVLAEEYKLWRTRQMAQPLPKPPAPGVDVT